MKIHACLMTMNELLDLRDNLVAMLPYVDTATVVDGGSIDGTIPYLRNWSKQEPRVRFFIHPWKDNFPAQRNNYLARVAEIAVAGDWIVAVDPDEVLDQAALASLRDIARVVPAKPEQFARVGFRCRSVRLRASDRVHQQEDSHWKGLFYRWSSDLHYTHHGDGAVHEVLSGADPMYMLGHHPEFPTLFYEHRKQENVIWPRGVRNYYCGGGGMNLGRENPRWVELREIAGRLGISTWQQMHTYLIAGNIASELKDWIVKYRRERGWDGSCFTPGQYAMSPTGAVPVEDLAAPDIVGQGLFSAAGLSTRIIAPNKKTYVGEVLTIRATNTVPVTVTPEHPILVADRIPCSLEGHAGWTQHWCRLDCVQSKPRYREDKRKPNWSGTYKNCSTEYAHELLWLPARDVVPGRHCVLYPRTPFGPGVPSISEAEAELRGWYQAEGWAEKNSVHLSLHESKDPIERIVGLAKEVYPSATVSVYPYPKKHAVTVRIGVGAVLAETFREEYGGRSDILKVPPCVWNFDVAQLSAYLRGYVGGDGSVGRKPRSLYDVVSIATASERLAFEVQHLLSRFGVMAGFSKTESRTDRYSDKPIYRLVVEGRQVSQVTFLDERLVSSDRQSFYLDDHYFYLPVTSVERSEYAGLVYNAETEDNTYLAAFAMHNSEQREWFKTYFRLYHPEEEPESLRGESIE